VYLTPKIHIKNIKCSGKPKNTREKTDKSQEDIFGNQNREMCSIFSSSGKPPREMLQIQ